LPCAYHEEVSLSVCDIGGRAALIRNLGTTPMKDPSVSYGQEAGWAPELV